jgi:hypothetical protein
MSWLLVYALGFGACLLPSAAAAAGEEQYVTYSGLAVVRHASKPLYGERHVLHYRDGRLIQRVVLYTCLDGSPFARKIVNYGDALAPDFDFEDSSNGMREGVRGGSVRRVYFRANPGEAERSAPLPQVADLVVDAGFDEFIRARWSTLMTDHSAALNFLVPSRLETIGFKLEHLHSTQVDGTAAEVFRMKLSGILGWIVSGIDVTYSAADHVLMHYDGLSDLRDASGDNFQTDISFHPKDRQPSSADAMTAATLAHIAPCR